jgi:ATP-dependent helicase/nuclease subunit B
MAAGMMPRAARGKAIANALAAGRVLTGKWTSLDAEDRVRWPGYRRLSRMATRPKKRRRLRSLCARPLETPERTAALVTPDRGSLRGAWRRMLARWGIESRRFSGPAARSILPSGTLLTALAEAGSSLCAARLADGAQASAGHVSARTRGAGSSRSAALDRVLRGPRPAAGMAGIAIISPIRPSASGELRRAAWWPRRGHLLAPIEAVFEWRRPAFGPNYSQRCARRRRPVRAMRCGAARQGHAAASALLPIWKRLHRPGRRVSIRPASRHCSRR